MSISCRFLSWKFHWSIVCSSIATTKSGLTCLLAFALLGLAGCGSEPDHSEFKIITSDSLIKTALPAIRRVCPGLDKYAPQFSNLRVEQQFRTAIMFEVSSSSKIPDAYKAGGHTCFIEVDADGKNIFIEKKACKSVCLDQVSTPDGQLKLSLGG
ncbi:hypothetical protein PVE90_18325 [Pseudomonas carnis]|nr:hypothetical protein [Pseudomonas carnis]